MRNSFIFIMLLLFNGSFVYGAGQTYNVVVIKDEKPYYFLDKQNKPTGYAVELFEKIAQKTDIKYNYIIAQSYAQAYKLFEQNKAHIIPNIGITQTKEHLFSFTQPTDKCDISIFERSKADIKTKQELQQKTIGVVAMHHCEELLTKDMVKAKVVFDSFEKMLQALKNGSIDAIAYSNAMALQKLKALSKQPLHKSSYKPMQSQRGVGISKDAFKLLPIFDEAITAMQLNGELEQLRQKWFKGATFSFTYKQLVTIIASIVILFIVIISGILFLGLQRRWVITQKHLKETIEKKTLALQQSNAAVKKYQKQLLLVMDSINDMIFYKDENLRYIGCNKIYEEYIGKKSKDILYKDDTKLFDQKSAALIIQTDKQILSSKQDQLRGDWIEFPAKGAVYAQTYLQTFEYEKGKIGILGVCRDNTKLQLAQKKIKDQRYIDELTQINNRKSYNKRVKELLYDYNRYAKPFCIIMYDIDNFKKINDTFGHKIGDDILVQMSAVVQQNLRETDYLFRIGGEEFVILLTNTTLNDAVNVAQKVKTRVYENIHTPDNNPVSISLGVSQITAEDSVDSLFIKVDNLLYKSKQEGKKSCDTLPLI